MILYYRQFNDYEKVIREFNLVPDLQYSYDKWKTVPESDYKQSWILHLEQRALKILEIHG